MPKKIIEGRRSFVLDTNVLMHDPTALFRFKEHDVYLPMVVLEELDKGKKGLSEVARNVRQASRFMDELLAEFDSDDITAGIPLVSPHGSVSEEAQPAGKLYFLTRNGPNGKRPIPDNEILAVALELQETLTDQTVTLVSKDINLRIKAVAQGVHVEDYTSDQAIEDADLLYKGSEALPDNFWETQSDKLESWKDGHRTFYKVEGEVSDSWHAGQFVYVDQEQGFEAIVSEKTDQGAVLELATDYRNKNHAVWGISARNREQSFALNLLMDPEVDFVSLVGTAGTGKTLLALAAGLAQTLDEQRYREIIMTRVTIPVGEDIGFLPGTEEEKMTPWMGALMDNLEVLTQPDSGGEWGRAATDDLLRNRIRIRSVNFMRGRTFLNRYIILDEAQNLTPKQMKTLITRAGPGTKIVCLGNIAQIDTPYLTETTSGLSYVVDRFKDWSHSGHIILTRGERSRLADYASELL